MTKEDKTEKERNHAIDLMKFFAAILITNSHMVSLYPDNYSAMAIGGSIGDALFFFCSGFLLMMGSNFDFFNWYKRRINRIFPTIFAVALVGIIFMGQNPSLKNVIVYGGGWFVQAIFLFYAVFWFVKRYLSNNLWIAFVIDTFFILAWYFLFWDKKLFILVDDTYLRWPVFFMTMLLGAATSFNYMKSEGEYNKRSGWLYLSLLVVLLLFYYGYQLMWRRIPALKDFQVILIPTLLGIVYVFYKLCSGEKIIKVYKSKYLHLAIYGISACCLEIYLSGSWCFGLGMICKDIFPLNLMFTFLLIFVLAYLVKVFSNFLSQTFKTENYDWKGMLKL